MQGSIPSASNIMAIVNGYQNSRWRKSVGNVTFRYTRGRIIASEKIQEATTRVPTSFQTQRQFVFGLINRFSRAHAADINMSFDKSKYGSERNMFFRLNYAALGDALLPLYETSGGNLDQISDAQIEEAVTDYATDNPTRIYRVKKAGFPTKYLSGEWSSTDNPISVDVYLGGVKIVSGSNRLELTTGKSFRISGDVTGAVVLSVADTSNGAPSDVAASTALTSIVSSQNEYSGLIAAAQNRKYLASVKVGGQEIVTLTAWEGGGEGDMG